MSGWCICYNHINTHTQSSDTVNGDEMVKAQNLQRVLFMSVKPEWEYSTLAQTEACLV